MWFAIITIAATIIVVVAVVYECIMLWKEINK